MGGVVGVVDAQRAADDASAVAGQFVEATQEASSLAAAAEETDVVAEHDDRVERSEVRPEVLDRDHASVADAAASHDVDRAGRVVDRDDGLTALLKVERNAARAGADVEHAAAREANCRALVLEPVAQR